MIEAPVAESLQEIQQRICRTYGAGFDPPAPRSKLGLAIQTLDRLPIKGIRLDPTETTCGWYIYAGEEWSDDADFYKPICVEHLTQYCRFALPFICLPPGWGFMTDGKGFIDVWREDEKEVAHDPARM
jgi:hypothetical protein